MAKGISLYFNTHLSLHVSQYDKMKGVNIEIATGSQSKGMLANADDPRIVVAKLKKIIEFIELKSYPIVINDKISIKDANHEQQVIRYINEIMTSGARDDVGKMVSTAYLRKTMNHFFHIKQRLQKGQKLTPKMQQNLGWIIDKIKEQEKLFGRY